LLYFGADPNAEDMLHRNSLDIAKKYNNNGVLKVILI
jgi:hypothetical protein